VAGPHAGAAAALTATDPPLASFPAAQLIDALRATGADGEPRRVVLSDGGSNAVEAEIYRARDGRVFIALGHSAEDEFEPLRDLARQMAGIVDTSEILGILCEAASVQCDAGGAAVLKAVRHEGEVVAASGLLASVRGHRFTLAGSLAREVMRTRDVVVVDDFLATTRPLRRAAPDLSVGPILLAPLIAHDTMLGVLTVAREIGAPTFTGREAHRLRVIADHAALAFWKAELLEQAQAADRAKSRFLATVSHELRTPLTALAGYEELLADQVIGPLSENQLDVLERMRAVTQHLAVVIEEVLTFSSLEGGHETVRATDFLAADLMRATAAVIEPLARQKHLAFHSTIPVESIRMTSDVDKIRQILVNLAGNAVKFTERGSVCLKLEARDGEVAFAVTDTGIGIARADIDRLFQPFAQLDAGLTRRHGGTGLGLYISRRLAELLSGRIEVDSEPGKGTTFALVLPRE
jgi:signal transduction histidine kinase